jgi:hypothetical protein
MGKIKLLTPFVLILFGGCATMPMGPSVRVLPAQGIPFEKFQADDAICRQWAERQIAISPQESVNQNVASGAVVGTLLGAGIGALLGAATGHPGEVAAFGAGSGLLVGAAAGANSGQISGWEAQRRYDNAYVQCMYSKGNQVPGAVKRVYSSRRVTPPPPPPDDYAAPPDYSPFGR